MTPWRTVALATLALLFAGNSPGSAPEPDSLRQQVEDTESAFARTMSERDFEGFQSFLADEAVFFSGDAPLVGKQAVAEAWQPFYQGESPPFSWAPEIVVVLESGTLALSSGPVFDPAGQRVATFNSIWRLGADGQWRIIFDKGSRDCEPPAVAESP